MKIIKSLNHTQLIEEVAFESGESKEVAADVLRAAFDVIGRTVAGGGSVTVTNFGSWYAREAAARQVRNPKTGETWHQGPKTQPRFRWAPAVKDAAASGEVPETFQKKASH